MPADLSPDHISADPKHTAYRPDVWKFDVFLDGERVARCVEACASEGWVRAMPLPSAGFKGAKALRQVTPERRDGKVEIRVRAAG